MLIIIPALFIGSRFGLIGIAVGHLIAVLLRRIISLNVATRFVRVSMSEIFGQLKPSFVSAAVMAPVALAVLNFTQTLHPFLQLTCVVLSGALSYLGMLWWIERENLVELIRIVRVRNASA